MSLAALAPEDHRAAPRPRVVLAAKLVFGGFAFTCDCVVRNITDKGATVRYTAGVHLPQAISLLETVTGRTHEARVVWQNDGQAGLAFSDTRDLHTAPPSDPMRRLWIAGLPR